MRFTLTPTPSNTATPSLTPSNTPSYTPTGTVCPGLTPTATRTPTMTQTNTQTNTSTPTGTIQTTPTATIPPPPSCECYQVENTTAEAVNITYTPCGDAETTVSVPGNGTLNFCVEPSTIIYPGIGLTYPTLCGISCVYDGVDCSTCGGGDLELMIYARDVAGTRATITMFYNVNSGANINIPGATGTQLPADCTYIYTITGLNNGDIVTVGTSINCVMTGAFGMIMTCPSSISSNIDFIYAMDAPAVQVISLTIDTDNIP